MNIVLDVNVIVAGLATRGLCADIVESCLRSPRQLVLSVPIIDDVLRILIEKFNMPAHQSRIVVKQLTDLAFVVVPKKIRVPHLRDKDDVVIIATAMAGNSKYIVTGDKDLLVLKNFEGIQFLTPREFYQSHLNEAL